YEIEKKGAGTMATYRDPVRCFAPLEVIERLLEIRVEAGYSPAVYLLSPDDLADYLDAYGFDVYALSEAEAEFHFGDYRAPLAPGGDHAHCSLTVHAKAQRTQRRKGGSNSSGGPETPTLPKHLTRLCVFAFFAPLRQIFFTS